ncbi:YkgJ family cysteine cluster protein [Riemerella anatipestifer]|uniref:YkgJ family cysteine cluster protein n=1 Tax=Riemerella anatipestifer TaxID=34085 RepID=UPI001BDAF54F|nr:YkgJ family cysteine cluster protein [Riemerella anatipestifer]MBT0548788.1 YkgJ family cysteine cluster protein [Riemerella anatipestifer]MBT0559551.1 YkgJ family cysteine cluster protein [Riemerella anatipestifer]
MDLELNRQNAQQKHKEHKKFLEKLKKKPPKNLDYLTQEIHNEVFDEIDRLSCANCCKTTGPLFTTQDIERISKFLKLKPTQFEEKYLRIDEDNDWVLQQLPCPFLFSDNTCMIYEVRPKACREFPHTDRKKIYQINHLTIKNIEICPATFKWIEKMREKIE